MADNTPNVQTLEKLFNIGIKFNVDGDIPDQIFDRIKKSTKQATKEVQQFNKQLSSNAVGRAVVKLNQASENFKKNTKAIRQGAQQIKRSFSGITSAIGVSLSSLSFASVIKGASQYNTMVASIAVNQSKFGNSITSITKNVDKLSSSTGFTRQAIMSMYKQMTYNVPLSSLSKMSNMMQNITKLTGADQKAMQQYSNTLIKVSGLYPGINLSIEKGSEKDRQRIRNLSMQLQMTGDLSYAQAQRVMQYANGTDKMDADAKQAIKRNKDYKDTLGQISQIWEKIVIEVGNNFIPVLSSIGSFLKQHKDLIQSLAKYFAIAVTSAIALKGAMAAMSALKGVSTMISGGMSTAGNMIKGGLSNGGGIVGDLKGGKGGMIGKAMSFMSGAIGSVTKADGASASTALWTRSADGGGIVDDLKGGRNNTGKLVQLFKNMRSGTGGMGPLIASIATVAVVGAIAGVAATWLAGKTGWGKKQHDQMVSSAAGQTYKDGGYKDINGKFNSSMWASGGNRQNILTSKTSLAAVGAGGVAGAVAGSAFAGVGAAPGAAIGATAGYIASVTMQYMQRQKNISKWVQGGIQYSNELLNQKQTQIGYLKQIGVLSQGNLKTQTQIAKNMQKMQQDTLNQVKQGGTGVTTQFFRNVWKNLTVQNLMKQGSTPGGVIGPKAFTDTAQSSDYRTAVSQTGGSQDPMQALQNIQSQVISLQQAGKSDQQIKKAMIQAFKTKGHGRGGVDQQNFGNAIQKMTQNAKLSQISIAQEFKDFNKAGGGKQKAQAGLSSRVSHASGVAKIEGKSLSQLSQGSTGDKAKSLQLYQVMQKQLKATQALQGAYGQAANASSALVLSGKDSANNAVVYKAQIQLQNLKLQDQLNQQKQLRENAKALLANAVSDLPKAQEKTKASKKLLQQKKQQFDIQNKKSAHTTAGKKILEDYAKLQAQFVKDGKDQQTQAQLINTLKKNEVDYEVQQKKTQQDIIQNLMKQSKLATDIRDLKLQTLALQKQLSGMSFDIGQFKGGDANAAKKFAEDSIKQIESQVSAAVESNPAIQNDLKKLFANRGGDTSKIDFNISPTASPQDIRKFIQQIDDQSKKQGLGPMGKEQNQKMKDRIKNAELLAKKEMAKNDIILKQAHYRDQTLSKMRSQYDLQSSIMQLSDSMGPGIGASVQMRQQLIDKLGQQLKITQQTIATQQASLSNSGLKPQDRIKIQTDINNRQKQRIGLMKQQADQAKAMRDGWVGAVVAQTIGTGRIMKLKIGADQNMRQAQANGAIRTGMSGAVGRAGQGRIGQTGGQRMIARDNGSLQLTGSNKNGVLSDTGPSQDATNKAFQGMRNQATSFNTGLQAVTSSTQQLNNAQSKLASDLGGVVVAYQNIAANAAGVKPGTSVGTAIGLQANANQTSAYTATLSQASNLTSNANLAASRPISNGQTPVVINLTVNAQGNITQAVTKVVQQLKNQLKIMSQSVNSSFNRSGR